MRSTYSRKLMFHLGKCIMRNAECHYVDGSRPRICLVIFSVKIHVKLSHRLAICRESVQYNRV